MSIFSAKDLAATGNIARKDCTVDLPELGVTMRLLAWSADVGLKVEALRDKAKKDTTDAAVSQDLIASMIVPAVVDEDSKPVFTKSSFGDFLKKMPRADLVLLIKAVMDLNAPKAAEEDSEAGKA